MLVRRVLLGSAYSADDGPTVRSLGKPALGPRLIKPGAAIAVLLLSLGLWAVIWTVVASLASAVFG
jgi:hypothetical protein